MIRKPIISIFHAKAILLLIAALFTGTALAQTYNESISVSGGGTLTYQYEVQAGSCGGGSQTSANMWQNFSYTPSGGAATSLGGSIDYIYPCSYYQINGGWDYETNSYSSDNWSNELDLSYGSCTIAFDAYEGSSEGSASISCPQATTGYIDPKYIIVGVTYAPPGPSSNSYVQYTNSNLVGSTSSISNSFTSGISSSVSIKYGLKIPEVSKGSITTTYTNSATQTSSTSSTVSTSVQSTNSFKTFGTYDYFAPVDHDYDTVWVWLNPAVLLSVSSNSIAWNGYGYDGTDEPGMDIIGIQVGYLNGDFGPMPSDLTSELDRAWANDQIWASGQGPALTTADLANILAADPFSSSGYGLNEITYDPPSPETPDHRFTLASCNGLTTFPYSQGGPSQTPLVYTCTLSYTNMSSQAQQSSSTTSQMFSVDASFSGSGFLAKLSADLKTSYSLSWTTGTQSSITSSTTSSASLSIQGPACNNATPNTGPCVPVYDSSGDQPTSFAVYQDNVYGTFMFAPVHYYQ